MRFSTEVEEKPASTTFEPFPAGEYEFVVEAAEDTQSSKGNDMIKLTLHIFNEAGHKRVLFEYIVDSAAWKIKQFCESCGMLSRFNSGELEAYELVGKTGRAKVVIEKSEQYGYKNKVAAYIKAPEQSPTRQSATRQAGGGSIDEDSIPFAPCWQ